MASADLSRMDSAQLQPLLDFLRLHQGWLVVAITLVAFAESLALVGILVPGVVMLFGLATLAGGGLLDLWVALLAACIGAILGDGLSYYLGRHFHQRLHGVWPFRRYPQVLQRGETFFRQHGGKSVVIGRFIGPIRPVIPLVAGMFDMPAYRFFIYNLVSALAWSPAYVLPGYLVGASINMKVSLPPHFYPILFATLLLLALALFLFTNLHAQTQMDRPLYRGLRILAQRSRWTARLWQRLASPRYEPPEFPLASLILLLGSLAGFVLLALLVHETHLMQPLNQAVQMFFQALRHPLYDPAFLILTLLGDPGLHYLLFSLLVAYLVLQRQFVAGFHVALAGLLTSFSILAMKVWFEIGRPELVSLQPDSLAFPSGHTGGAMVFWGLLASFIAQELPSRRRWQIYGTALLPPLLIGMSRIYLGVHWLSDVLGGLLWGWVICALTRLSFSPWNRRPLTLGWPGALCLSLAILGASAYLILRYPLAVDAYAPRLQAPPAPVLDGSPQL